MIGSGGSQPRVVVIGGSLGGLSAALWLRDVGCDVEAFERTPVPLEDRGAGIVLHPATIRYLAAHRLLDVEQISAAANWFRHLTRDGSVAHQEPHRFRFTAYNALYRCLLRCLEDGRYHLAEECSGFDQDPDGVTVRFVSGRVERCDLLVCADGINSLGRRLLLPEVRPRYAGYVAWRGTVGEDELTGDAFALLREAISYVLMPDSHAIAYPIPNRDGAVEPGSRLTDWLWYRNVTPGAELDDLLPERPRRGAARHLGATRACAGAPPPATARRCDHPAAGVRGDDRPD